MTPVLDPIIKRNLIGFLCILIVACISGRSLNVFSTGIPIFELPFLIAPMTSSAVLSYSSYVSVDVSFRNISKKYFLQIKPTLLAALSMGTNTNWSLSSLRSFKHAGSFSTFLTGLNVIFFFSFFTFSCILLKRVIHSEKHSSGIAALSLHFLMNNLISSFNRDIVFFQLMAFFSL